MTKIVSFKALGAAVLLIGCLAVRGGAQSQQGADSGSAEEETKKTDNSLSLHSSITERFLSTMRAPVSFSVGVFAMTAPDSGVSTTPNNSSGITMVRPQILANIKAGRSQLLFDYAFRYRRDIGHGEVHSNEHAATLGFKRRLSRNVTLDATNTFRSAVNDYGALPVSAAPQLYQLSLAQALYVPRVRSTTNSLVTSINYRAGKRMNLTVFSSYDMWRYGASSFGNSQGVQIGIRTDYRINKWLSFDNSYSRYLTQVSSGVQPAGIQRLEVGGFKFQPRPKLELFMAGGADSTRFEGRQRIAGSFQGGITKSAKATSLSLVYRRGFSSAIGPQATFNGSIVSASLSQWLSRKVSFSLTSGYNRGTALDKKSKLEYISGNAELQIALSRQVLFSAQSSYVSQHGTNLPTDASALNRRTVSIGLQFFFSSLNARR